MIRIAHVEPEEYIGPLLELWNRNLEDRFPLDEKLLRQQLALDSDEKILYAAFDCPKTQVPGRDEVMVGATLVKRRRRQNPDGRIPALGNISFILVDGTSRRHGTGTLLLAKAELWLRDRGVTRLDFGRDRYHFFPGCPQDGSPSSLSLEAFLLARGFILSGAESDLAADLGLLDLTALSTNTPLPAGYRFIFYGPPLRASLLAFFERNFPGRWLDDTFEALDAGMRDKDLALLVEESSGKIVGFARLYDTASPILGPGVYWRALMGSTPGGLGPIGVDRDRRGLGLGLAFLRAALEELAHRGVRTCVIDWTDLEAFYAKMGFAVWKRYRMASKESA